MISIYSQDNTEYTKNGDAVLIPTRCDLALTINGAWQLTLEHPYDQEERYKYIVEGAVVQCDIKCIRELPATKQRFRIYTYTKGLHGITAIGFPIAMEATYDAPIDNLVISGKTGSQAMALIQAFTNKYTLSTDVTKTASASMSNTNVNSAIASGNSNSFIGAWGGEILYSNYDFMVKSRLGDNVAGDHRIIYGRNLTNIEYKKDDSGLTTRIYPISEDGIRLNGTGYVDSPKINDYPVIHHRFMQAPYNLIDTDASSASATAQQTRTSLAAISTQATTLSQGVNISSYPPEYIKQQRADIVAAVQTMALNGVISTSLYNAAAKTISDAMAWMNNLAQPEWDWMGSYEAGWKYGNNDGYAVSQYVKIGKTWRYFGANGNWQEPADSSNEWDWYQNTEETGKKYGDFSRYFAHNEYVFITLSGQLKQYWFNEEGWYEESESGDSDYAWNGSGTAEDPWWFGESSSKYLKSCWAFIDGKYYFFDEYGYYDGSTKFDDYQWDWVDDGSRAWFGNPDHEYAAFYLVNQWCKIDGSWYYFDANGYVYDDNAARANVISLYTTGMASLATTVSTQATALYTLLYSLMTAYAQSKFSSGVDMPYITITVNMADLSKTTEYAGYENLETVKLGDSVECIDNEHDISMTNRVIGLTYDVIRDYNSEVVLGNAAATVASIIGNANGQAVAGGFDTSAIESQLDSLQNKMGDFLLNGASVVTNGVGQLNLQAGENISISRDGHTLTISGEGGGQGLEYFVETENTLYGRDNTRMYFLQDHCFRFDGTVTMSTKYSGKNFWDRHTVSDIDENDIVGVRGSSFRTPNISGADGICIISKNPAHCKFTVTRYTGTYPSETNPQTVTYEYSSTHGVATRFFNGGAWSDSFTYNGETYYIVASYNSQEGWSIAWDQDKIVSMFENRGYLAENYPQTFDTLGVYGLALFNAYIGRDCYNGIARNNGLAFFAGGTDANGTDAPIKIYSDGHTEGLGKNYRAGANIQIDGDEISATDTTYSPFTGATSQEDGASGLVPTPTTSDVDKVLGANGQWVDQTGGTEVEANPSGTATATLQKVDIDGVIYDIQGGGGGNTLLIQNAEIYSEDEKQVGVYADGKPIYQKTFIFQSYVTYNGQAWTITTIPNSGMEKIIRVKAVSETGTNWDILGATRDTGNYVYVYNTRNSAISVKEVTLQYTKSADAAGSGGYQAWGFSPIIYSTEEREVGVWKDNKPLYCKTIQATLTSTNHPIDVSGLNIDTFVDARGFLRYQSGNDDQTADYPYYSGSDFWSGGYFHKGRKIYYVQSSNDSVTYYNIANITFYYTKTTDVAGSGSYNTLGVPNVHYSTDEQVIGTWVDGSTIYEKTIETTLVAGSVQTVQHLITNVNKIVGYEGKIIDNGGICLAPHPFMGSPPAYSWMLYDVGLTYFRYNASSYLSGTVYVTLRYTKSS